MSSYLRKVERKFWVALLEKPSDRDGLVQALRDLQPSAQSGLPSISLYAFTNDDERLVNAIALCAVRGKGSIELDYVEISDEDLNAARVSSRPAHTPEHALKIPCEEVRQRHYSLQLSDDERERLATTLADRMRSKGLSRPPRYSKAELKRRAATCDWLDPEHALKR